jgi:hypothetical protein
LALQYQVYGNFFINDKRVCFGKNFLIHIHFFKLDAKNNVVDLTEQLRVEQVKLENEIKKNSFIHALVEKNLDVMKVQAPALKNLQEISFAYKERNDESKVSLLKKIKTIIVYFVYVR